MKKYLNIYVAVLLSALTVSLASCSKNDDEPNDENSSVVGTWKVETMKISDDWWQVDYCQFAEGGKYTNVTVVYFNGMYDVQPTTSSWSQSGNKITIGGDTGTIKKINSNSMTISFNGEELNYQKCSEEEMNQYL